jgi:hypothetical protein
VVSMPTAPRCPSIAAAGRQQRPQAHCLGAQASLRLDGYR